MKYNENFRKLSDSYVFAGINARKATAKEKWGDKLLDLGVGDVKLPLFPVVAEEMKKAIDEMTTPSGFKGYSPSSGYDFLKEAIAKDYSDKGVTVRKSEIYVNDGAKDELYDIFGLLNPDSRIIIPTPCYPAVAEANLLLGNEVIYVDSDEDFIPYPPFGTAADAVYLCSPSNPSGTALDYKTLSLWVNYAISANAVIVFDGAYSDFLSDGYPDSIFRIPNAKVRRRRSCRTACRGIFARNAPANSSRWDACWKKTRFRRGSVRKNRFLLKKSTTKDSAWAIRAAICAFA